MGTHPSFLKAREEFDKACNNPDHTLLETAPVEINDLLQTHYSTSEPVRLTKTMLWDAETKKAWDPMTCIPGVVREGSSWGRKPLENGEECFLRGSQQRSRRASGPSRWRSCAAAPPAAEPSTPGNSSAPPTSSSLVAAGSSRRTGKSFRPPGVIWQRLPQPLPLALPLGAGPTG